MSEHRWFRRTRLLPRALATTAFTVTSLVTGCTTDGSPAVSDRATWSGTCPFEESPSHDEPPIHVVAFEFSASDRSRELIDARLTIATNAFGQAADCEARLVVAVLEAGRTVVLHDAELRSELATEIARDIEVPRAIAAVLEEVDLGLTPVLSSTPADGSDPGAIFRLLDEELSRSGPEAHIVTTVFSDGIAITAQVDLNRPIDPDEVDRLATDVAPLVDLGNRVAIDWVGMGGTTDPTGPPSPWLDRLVDVWERACEIRNATPCHISTTQRG